MSTTETVYVVRDAAGEYLTPTGTRSPASDEAREFEAREEAAAACERGTDRVLSREVGDADAALVCGRQVQVDRSGVGHCWADVAADDLPGQIREEIEGEIVDGGRESGGMVGSNGLHYRW